MSDLELRIKSVLEPVLEMADPRQRISAYHDMPYALFRYDPEEEFDEILLKARAPMAAIARTVTGSDAPGEAWSVELEPAARQVEAA